MTAPRHAPAPKERADRAPGGSPGHADSPGARALALGQYGLFAVLMVVATVRALWPSDGSAHTAGTNVGTTIGVAPLVGATTLWYLAGVPLHRRAARAPQEDRAARGADAARVPSATRTTPPAWVGYAWFAGLVALWVGLVLASTEYAWVAFPLYLLAMHLLPRGWGAAAVALLAIIVVAAQLASGTGSGGPGQVVGPVIGALVAVGAVVTYERVVAEADERHQLLSDLVAAQRDLLAANEVLAETQREAGALAERARLARDIHDTLAQGFSSIVLLSRAALAHDGTPERDEAGTTRGDEAGTTRGDEAGTTRGDGAGTTRGDDASTAEVASTRAVLAQIEATAAENLAEARRVVAALAPADLAQAPLAAALRRQLDRLGAHTGLQTSLTVDGVPTAVPTAHDAVLLRVAQGALANVRQHAGASRVGVTLSYAADATTLDVVDDGRGFAACEQAGALAPGWTPSGPASSGSASPGPASAGAASPGTGRARLRADGSGFGLAVMRARLADVGGVLVIESQPGEGTAVSATIPLQEAPA